MPSKFLPFLLTFFVLSKSFASAPISDNYFSSLLSGDSFGSVINLNSAATVYFTNLNGDQTNVSYAPYLNESMIAISPNCSSDTTYCGVIDNLANSPYLYNGNQFVPEGHQSYQSILNLSATDENKLASSDSNITNMGVLKQTYELNPGAYTFNWAFAAYDYMPFRDGAFFHLYNNDAGTSEISILARNGTEEDAEDTLLLGRSFNGYDPQTLVMPNFGSTPWQEYNFDISSHGSYTLAFGVFNYGDTALDPTLFLSGFAGAASGDGLITDFFEPSYTKIIAGGGPNLDGIFSGSDTFYPIFEDGTYKITSLENTNPLTDFFISSGFSGTFDTASDITPTVIGSISGPGDLIISGNGSLFLSNVNTYTGSTTINSGATLLLNGLEDGSAKGSISNSSKVTVNGVFDISTECPGCYAHAAADNSIQSLDGSGSVVLGLHNLIITNGADNFSGVISGSGNVTLSSGTQTFSGINTYTGTTTIDLGSTLLLSSVGSISDSSKLSANGIFDITNAGSDNSIQSLDGSGSVVLGLHNLIITNGADNFSGVISGSGNVTLSSGTQTFSGINTYTGTTTIDLGSTLLLSSVGSISDSSEVSILGGLDINGLSSGTSVQAISGLGNISLGANTLTVNGGTQKTFDGSISGSGGLIIENSSNLALSNAHTYEGFTSIDSGSTLALISNGNISTSSEITINSGGLFDINGLSSGTSVQAILGLGNISLGANMLTVNGGTTTIFEGVISGSGGLIIDDASNLTLSAESNYTGNTTINSNSILQLTGGSIADSAVTINGSSSLTISGNNVYDSSLEIVNLDADIKSLAGSGSVAINGDALKIGSGTGNYSGVLSGQGGLFILGGNQTLSGTNTYGANPDYSSITAVIGGTLNISRIENLGGTQLLALMDGGTIHIAGDIDMSSRNLEILKLSPEGSESGTINVDANKTLTFKIDDIENTNTAELIKTGLGSLKINQADNYLGSIELEEGNLIIGSSNTYSSAAVHLNNLTIANNANLYGHGTIHGDINNSGNVIPGGSIGTLSIVGDYTQASSGNLLIEIGPSDSSKIVINGLATLAGSLTINALSGNYVQGSSYKILDANTLSGTFNPTIESSGRRLTYGLIYDEILADVYLEILAAGPSDIDTQASLNTQARRLRSTFNSTMASSNFANMNTYDCNLFDKNNMCISAGGRYTNIDNPSSNNSAAVVVLGYKASSNIRIGGFLDQSVNNNTPTGINVSNKNPMMGAFAVWNKNADGLGYQVKIANAYQDKDVTSTRDAFGDSGEAGTGKTNLNMQSYVGELSYAFNYQDSTIVRPYFAVRYTNIKQDAYTENLTEAVTSPLSYAKLEDRSTTALMGVKLNHALTPRTNLTASLGLEQNLHHRTDQLTASGVDGLASENFNNNIKHTRPVASAGAYYAVAKNQRLSADLYYQQLPFQSTGSATAYFNYMIGF